MDVGLERIHLYYLGWVLEAEQLLGGSVVNKDCAANCLYAGNPARKIKELK